MSPSAVGLGGRSGASLPSSNYDKAGELRRTQDSLLKINTIPLSRIGTDPARQTCSSGGLSILPALLAGHTIPTPRAWGWTRPSASASSCRRSQPTALRPDASGSRGPGEAHRSLGNRPWSPTVERCCSVKPWPASAKEVNDAWFAQNPTSGALRSRYDEDRLNCIRAGAGYKARPLNGVWATAPFLHNGSGTTFTTC